MTTNNKEIILKEDRCRKEEGLRRKRSAKAKHLKRDVKALRNNYIKNIRTTSDIGYDESRWTVTPFQESLLGYVDSNYSLNIGVREENMYITGYDSNNGGYSILKVKLDDGEINVIGKESNLSSVTPIVENNELLMINYGDSIIINKDDVVSKAPYYSTYPVNGSFLHKIDELSNEKYSTYFVMGGDLESSYLRYYAYMVSVAKDEQGNIGDFYVSRKFAEFDNYDSLYSKGSHCKAISTEKMKELYGIEPLKGYIYIETFGGYHGTGSSMSSAVKNDKIRLLEIKESYIENNHGYFPFLSSTVYCIAEREMDSYYPSTFHPQMFDYAELTQGQNKYEVFVGKINDEYKVSFLNTVTGELKETPLPIKNLTALHFDKENLKIYCADLNNMYTMDVSSAILPNLFIYKKEDEFYKVEEDSLVKIDVNTLTPEIFEEHGSSVINKDIVSREKVTVCGYCAEGNTNMNISMTVKASPYEQLVKQVTSYSISNDENKIVIPNHVPENSELKMLFSNNHGYSWRTIEDGEIVVAQLGEISTRGFAPQDITNLSAGKAVQALGERISFAYLLVNNNKSSITIGTPIITKTVGSSIFYENCSEETATHDDAFTCVSNEGIKELGFVTASTPVHDITEFTVTDMAYPKPPEDDDAAVIDDTVTEEVPDEETPEGEAPIEMVNTKLMTFVIPSVSEKTAFTLKVKN